MGRMAANGVSSISKGVAVMRRYTHEPWRTGVCGGCGQGGNRAAGQGKIPSLSNSEPMGLLEEREYVPETT
uniref:Uncharacterized protein n=1 Tax=Oryza meridionalis TaxID=40149 RepID=A0A0E0EV66_9ORYZ